MLMRAQTWLQALSNTPKLAALLLKYLPLSLFAMVP